MNKISAKHFMFLIFGTAIMSLKTYPAVFAAHNGRDVWIATIIASIIFYIYYNYIISIYNYDVSISIKGIYKKAFGKYLGCTLLFFYALNLLLSSIESMSIEISAIHANIFIESPPWYIGLILIIPSLYIVRKDMRSILIVTIIALGLMLLSGVLAEILVEKYKSYKLLLPIMQNGMTKDFILSIIKIVSAYASIAITLPYISSVEDNKKLKKYTIIALIITSIIEIFSIMGLVATFGPLRDTNIFYPKLIQTQRVSFWRFIESGDFLILMEIIGGWFIKFLLTFKTFCYVIEQLFETRINKYFSYIVIVIIYITCYFITKNNYKLFQLLNHYLYICLFNYLLVPIVAFTLYKIRSKP
ncbi:endospore germination permease [Clostridium amazonitimonense]|uniref:endospore germination permease n=1 Tax=Clostridium amazonitimonense TaxID=1499689 RepID=UPI000509F0D6|nr:endospore germination permease [Clostridium amazonitimonense]